MASMNMAVPSLGWRDSTKMGAFYPEIPEGKKPTHIVVGAGSAGCVMVSTLGHRLFTTLLLRQTD